MGLDTVELVLAIEEEFGIVVTDDDAAGMATPRLMIDFIFSQFEAASQLSAESRRCASQLAFHRLRQSLIRAWGVKRSQIRLNTKIRSFLGPHDQRFLWAQLKSEVSADNWPNLSRPSPIKFSINFLVLVLFLALICRDPFLSVLWLILCSAIWIILSLLTLRFRSKIPNSMSVRDLVPFCYQHSDRVHIVRKAEWAETDRTKIAERVRCIVIDQLGIRPAEYHEDARFIEDLGVD